VTIEQHRQTQKTADSVIVKMIDEGAVVIDPTPYLTNKQGRCGIVMDGVCMYWDSDHLTVSGARHLVPLFKDVLNCVARE
jgi:SGNH domain (fused to AT3 domains)